MSKATDIPTAFAEALVEVGTAFGDVVVLDADLADSCKTESFRVAFPDRVFDLGVAEQSLPTFAAGLALAGKIPIYNTFAVFAVHRGLDMIRQAVAYSRTNVKIVGHAAGQSLGYAGPSHHTIEDLSVMRALPNMVILCPSDADEARQMVWWMVQYDGPVYLRLTRAAGAPIHAAGYRFEFGKTVLLRHGRDLSVFTCGDLATIGLALHDSLSQEGIGVQVVSVPTLKPLPAAEILRHGRETRGALTIEDHNVIGGLGGAVAEIYAEHLQKPVRRMGIPDTFTESDDRDTLLRAYGVSLEAAATIARRLLAAPKPT